MGLEAVDEETQELGGVLLHHGVYGRVETFEEVVGDEVLSLGEVEVGHQSLEFGYVTGLLGYFCHHETISEWFDYVEHLDHSVDVAYTTQIVEAYQFVSCC